MKAHIVIALLAAVVPAAAWAQSAVTLAGSSRARACFEAAQQPRIPREAERTCDRALSEEGLTIADRAATLVNRGIVRMQAQKLAAALADYDAAIAARPETAEAYVNKGIALTKAGRDAEAVQTLSEAIARNPERPEIAYYTRAMAQESLGRVREAYEDYSRAAQLAPAWAEPAEQLQRFKTIRRKTATA